ncbi:recombinase family protein [Lewinella sp. W8]|uniref:recombinase family protein n=1 Tax=Lewinella sp. W8 TaxID=2528208 RepID=UPI00106892DA|nr:hypothetical protein [Lewinella sp. W8]
MKITDHIYFAVGSRVSTKKQDAGISIESQDKGVEGHILKSNPKAQILFNFAAAESGWKANRANIQKAYDELRRHNQSNPSKAVTCFVFLQADRYIRNLLNGASWIEKFQQIGVYINIVERWVDWDDTMSVSMFMLDLARAEEYSKKNSQNIKRCYTQRVEVGILPVPKLPRIYVREWITRTPKNYRILKGPAWEPFVKFKDYVLAGINMKAAWRRAGGKEALGSYDSAIQLIENPMAWGMYRGYPFDAPAPMTPEEGRKIARMRSAKQAKTAKSRKKQDAFMAPVCACPHCSSRLTLSVPNENTRRKPKKYLICGKFTPRHYRIDADKLNKDALELIQQLTLSGRASQRLGKKAEERSRILRANTEIEVKNLRAEAKKANEARQNIAWLLATGAVSVEDRDAVIARCDEISDRLADAEARLKNHGKILESVLQGLNNLGAIFREEPRRDMLTDFLLMAFPDGLIYDQKLGIFRTTTLNSALTVTTDLSSSCTKLKTRLPTIKASNRVMSG